MSAYEQVLDQLDSRDAAALEAAVQGGLSPHTISRLLAEHLGVGLHHTTIRRAQLAMTKEA